MNILYASTGILDDVASLVGNLFHLVYLVMEVSPDSLLPNKMHYLLMNIVVRIMVELLSVLALATKQISQGRFSNRAVTYTFFAVSMCYGEVHEEAVGGEIEAVLWRLDRLIKDEAQMTVAQTLGASVVRGLVCNMKVVIEGAEHNRCIIARKCFSDHLFGLSGKTSRSLNS